MQREEIGQDPDFDSKSVFQADDYLYFYESALKDEYSDQEISFIVRELALDRSMGILDLACGHGRHANRLAALGHAVTGIDSNPDFLAIAQKEAEEKGLKIRYLCSDSRQYSSPGEFDRVIHLFSSFGYFSDADNEQVLRNVAKSLNPGDLFCFDILNRDVFLKDLPRCAVREKNGDLLIDRHRFDSFTGRLYNSRIVIRDGKRRDMTFFLRLYNPTEIVALLERMGLVLKKICRDWNGKPFGGESKRMILIVSKDARGLI